MTDRSIASEEKRRLILDAAVRVFARRGYHTSRVGDIAEEAGVAHGLLYHYFSSKEELLETVFRSTWTELLDAMRRAEEEEPREARRQVAAILLRSWRRDRDLVRVLVLEVARSPHVQERVGEFAQAFAAIERIVARGQDEGAFRADIGARLASYVFYGALEEILTGWVLGQLPDGDDDVARAERAVVAIVADGLATGTPAPSAA